MKNDRGREIPNGEHWVWLAAAGALLPVALPSLLLIWLGDWQPKLQWTLTLVLVGACVWFPLYLHERIVYSLRTIANMLTALREGDYSHRLQHGGTRDALGQVLSEVNLLRDTLQKQRVRAAEASALLEKVMDKIDVGVFAFDHEQRLRLINASGIAMLNRGEAANIGETAVTLGLDSCLVGEAPRVVNLMIGGRSRRWEIRRAAFRERGEPHQLLVLADLTSALRREELGAWQRLVRVLRHEISNSLAPISSYAETLTWLLDKQPRPVDWEDDFREGLDVIAGRSAALRRMVAAYKDLTGLPAPRKESIPVAEWTLNVVAMETRLSVDIVPGPSITIAADRLQMEQLLINLIRNAVDAVLERDGSVSLSWCYRHRLDPDVAGTERSWVEIRVEDDGPGIDDIDHLFVPFFTTKEHGTGIGLVLSRQIAEMHGGTLHLENRENDGGCRALLSLPLPDEPAVSAADVQASPT